MSVAVRCDLQGRLEAELERLRRLLKLGYELKVRWIPNNDSRLSGEVRGETIYVYDEKEELALDTLRHEFIDYAISKVIEPYRQVANSLVRLINEEAYRRKGKLVEGLTKLI